MKCLNIMYCVYIHKYNEKWFYIGHGNNKRPFSLNKKDRSITYWKYVKQHNIDITKINIEIIFTSNVKEECFQLEQSLINASNKIMNLANFGTDMEIQKHFTHCNIPKQKKLKKPIQLKQIEKFEINVMLDKIKNSITIKNEKLKKAVEEIKNFNHLTPYTVIRNRINIISRQITNLPKEQRHMLDPFRLNLKRSITFDSVILSVEDLLKVIVLER